MFQAISSLKSILVTLYRAPATAKAQDKEWLNFYHLMSTAAGGSYEKTLELEYQIQIGSKLFPEYPCRSLSESYTIEEISWNNGQ